MNLLLVQEQDLAPDATFELTGRRAEHVACVLRAKEGDRLKAGLLGGRIGTATVLSCVKKSVRLRLNELPTPPPPPCPILPLVALPRPQSFKKVLHFIASSGIRRAAFFQAAKVEKSYWTSSALQPDAIRGELFEGLEQGCMTVLPELIFLKSPQEAAHLPELPEHKLVAHPRGARPCPRAIENPVALAIGPEGGFSDGEVDLFLDAGFQPVTFGPAILRVEFALAALFGRLS